MTDPKMPVLREGAERADFYADDEISLIDLAVVLVRRRWVIFGVFALCTAVGAVVAWVKPAQYKYTAAIAIAHVPNGSALQPIESPQAVLARVDNVYVPSARSALAKRAAGKDADYPVSASVPEGSSLIWLEAKGSEADGDDYKSLYTDVADSIRASEHAQVESFRKNLQAKRQADFDQLEQLKSDSAQLRKREQAIENSVSSTNKQIDELQRQVADTQRKLRKASSASGSSESVNVLNGNLMELLSRLDDARSTAQVRLPAEQTQIVDRLSDNLQSQVRLRSQIADLEGRLDGIVEAKVVAAPARSLKPVGVSAALIVVLSVILGLILGVLAAFSVEFGKAVGAHMEG